MRVLVTGGLGYIGGRLCPVLAADPSREVVATSRKVPESVPDWLGAASLQTFDLLGDRAALTAACRDVDCIVHLAGMNAGDSGADPLAALRVTGGGTLALLQAAIEATVSRFIYLSTAHVYGAPLAGRITEETLPRPSHPYAITHRTAEDFVLAAQDRGQIEGIVIRLSNGIGAPATPEADCWQLIGTDLCRQAITTGRLKLNSAGLQRRDFIMMSDVVAGIAHLADLPAAQIGDGLFNLGGGQSRRIIDVTESVANRAEVLLGERPPIERPEPGEGETHPDLDYSVEKLLATGFRLSGSLDEEIDHTLELCQRSFSAA